MVFTTEPGIDPDQSTYVDPFTVDDYNRGTIRR